VQPWFKLWPERLLSPAFYALSPAARSTYLWSFVLAAQAREKGLAMVVADLAVLTGLPASRQALVLKEVANRGLVELEGDVIRVPLFDEMQRPRSSAERMRALRERDGSVTLPWGESDAERDGESDGAVTKKSRRETPPSSTSPSGDVTDSGGRGARSGPDPVPWAEQVRTESNALGDRDLATLTPTERFVVARRHALEFAGCTKSEGRNASAARGIASGIASLTERLNRDRVDLTVADYLRAGRLVWERGGKSPWYKPHDVVAELVDAT
jgi:hypothetical protein